MKVCPLCSSDEAKQGICPQTTQGCSVENKEAKCRMSAEVKLVGTPPKKTSQCEERFEQSFDGKNSIEDWTGI